MCSYFTNHNILSLRYNFTIRPSTGYIRVGHSPQYIYYELLVSPGVYIGMTMSGGLRIGWSGWAGTSHVAARPVF